MESHNARQHSLQDENDRKEWTFDVQWGRARNGKAFLHRKTFWRFSYFINWTIGILSGHDILSTMDLIIADLQFT